MRVQLLRTQHGCLRLQNPPGAIRPNNITSLTSDFTESMPQISDLNAEAAYDMWLNNWKTEIMVWVDTAPAKVRNLAYDGMTEVGTYTYNGQDFALWRSGSGITGFYVFLLDHNETSGTVDLKAMLETMVSLGYIPATSPLTQIPFGWEMSSTGRQAGYLLTVQVRREHYRAEALPASCPGRSTGRGWRRRGPGKRWPAAGERHSKSRGNTRPREAPVAVVTEWEG